MPVAANLSEAERGEPCIVSGRVTGPGGSPIPDDGPVGKLLAALGRRPYRPAHIHFIVSAHGFVTVTTQVFSAGNPYLNSDAVFGVMETVVDRYVCHDSAEEAAALDVTAPFHTVGYNFELVPAG